MKYYVYNINYKNEFLGTLERSQPGPYVDCSTTVSYPQEAPEHVLYAFSPSTQKWDIALDDYRGVLFYNSQDSRQRYTVTKIGPAAQGYINIAPPDDTNKYTYSDNAWTLAVSPEELPTQLDYEHAVDALLLSTAQARGYDTAYTCLSYLNSTNVTWKAQAQHFNLWRDSVWETCHAILNQVTSGARAQPTIQQLLDLMPLMDWGD